MDPSRNSALQNAKLHSLFPSIVAQHRQSTNTPSESESSAAGTEEGMPPPPAYHSVVNPPPSIANLLNPYEQEEEDKDEDETPEVNINATTQIRGHGNIISITQMDSVRIANLIAILLHGGVPPTVPLQNPAQARPQGEPQVGGAHRQRTENTERKHWPSININVNCGATVVGDRNILGPGFGDIARHMQMRAQATQQTNQMHPGSSTTRTPPNGPTPGLGFPVHGQGVPTPPMSRSGSIGSESSSGLKRKVEEGAEESPSKRSR